MPSHQPITVECVVHAPTDLVWSIFTQPAHIVRWAFASDDWEARDAENDLRVGGQFKTVMAAKDGSEQFDFTGMYSEITPHSKIAYTMSDGRKVQVTFTETPSGVRVQETFEPETEHTDDIQRAGWQAILNQFKKVTEEHYAKNHPTPLV